MDLVKFKQTISIEVFKGCLPQILLGPFLNTWTHLTIAFPLLLAEPKDGVRRSSVIE